MNQDAITQAIDAIDETIAIAQQIRSALVSKAWPEAFRLVVELGINTTTSVAFVASVATMAAGLEALKVKGS